MQALISSLENQKFKNFRLLVRDDGSDDNTGELLSGYARCSNLNINLLPGSIKKGIVESFNIALKCSSADYILFCDQDDVWNRHKVSVLLDAMELFEKKRGKDVPLLVHSDLEVVNDSLASIAPSMWQYQKLNAVKRTQLKHLLVQNCITGCAMMINRVLADLAVDPPSGVIMHDWYIGLIAAAFGYIMPVPVPLVKYRQHGKNAMGSAAHSATHWIKKGFKKSKYELDQTFVQARAFHEKFGNAMGKDKAILIQEYMNISQKNIFSKRWTIARHGFWKEGMIRNAGMLLLL